VADGGAEIFGEGECDDAPGADSASSELGSFLGKYRGSLEGAVANVVSHGLISALEVSSDGKVVRLHAHATREQVDAVIGFVAAQLGVDVGTAPAGAGTAGAPR
jgi:hypothetical protein